MKIVYAKITEFLMKNFIPESIDYSRMYLLVLTRQNKLVVKIWNTLSIATEGASLTLTVSVEGSPQPTVKWYKDNKELKKGNATLSQNGMTHLITSSLTNQRCYVVLSCDTTLSNHWCL